MQQNKSYPALQRAVNNAWKRHGFRSYREAEDVTGLERTTLFRMRKRGWRPSRGMVIQFAEALREPINDWLVVAQYDPIPEELVHEETHTR